jgi:threonine/homoserine/homoserine lactone efflux protein
VEWHRESDERLLAVVYAAAGMYLAYEGVKLIRKGGSAAARKQ